MYDDNGNGRITCAEARAHGIAPVHREHPAYEYMRDADGDGVVWRVRTDPLLGREIFNPAKTNGFG